jgi:hypothetical protein
MTFWSAKPKEVSGDVGSVRRSMSWMMSSRILMARGRHLNIGPDGTVEMSAEDAKYLIRDGWTKLAEWSCDDVV